MTNKAIQKILTTNCEKIVDLVNEIYNALEDYNDDGLTDITSEWLNVIEQCAGVDMPSGEVNSTVHDSIEYLNNCDE